MPVDIRPFVEQQLDIQGELEVRYEDYSNGPARLRHFLKSEDRRIALDFKATPPRLPSGEKVAAHGVYLDIGNDPDVDGAMALNSGVNILTLAADGGGGGGSNGGTTGSLPNTFGEQLTAVLLVNFQNNATYQPWTPDYVQAFVFGTVSNFFAENSNGQTWLTGNVYGYYTLPIDQTCSPSTISTYANQAAIAAGVDLSSYSRLVYLFPAITTCGWSGQGTVGGTPSTAWINGRFNLRIVGHELGHNFGLLHSHDLDCGTAVVGDNCATGEYGDNLDIMGSPNPGHFTAYQKERLGWLTSGAGGITTVAGDGNYLVEPYETTPGTNPKVLKILRGPDPSTGKNVWYYINYRQASGFDGFLSTNQNVLNGVVFHLGTETDANSSQLLDMTPASTSPDLDDAALEAGSSYTDSVAGVTVSVASADALGATINVTTGVQSCVRAGPSVTVSPSVGPWVSPGVPVTYTVTVTNNDGAACSTTLFNLSSNVPDGWSGSFASSTFSLDSGASGQTSWTVTSSSTAANGFYDVTATATNSQDNNRSGAGTATYVIDTTNNTADQPPVAVDDSVTLTDIAPTTIAVLANDFDPDGDPLTVHSVTQGNKGTVTITADGEVIYTPARSFKNSDSFTYDVSDGVGTSTATVSISFQKSANVGSKGKGGRH